MAGEHTFKLKIITPNRVFYEGEAIMVEFTTTEGQMGVYKDHIPLTAVLVPSKVTITSPKGLKIAAVHSGFVEILKDQVVILAEVAEWPEEIDQHRAEEAKVRAERRIASSDSSMNLYRAELALKKSLIRIDVSNGK